MTIEDDRAAQYRADQANIVAKRQAAARRLLAPAAPRASVMAAWAPIRTWIAERRTVGGDRGGLGR